MRPAFPSLGLPSLVDCQPPLPRLGCPGVSLNGHDPLLFSPCQQMLVESLAVSGEGPGRMVRVTMAGMGPSGERRKATEVSSSVLTFHPALRQLGVRRVPISKVGRSQHP